LRAATSAIVTLLAGGTLAPARAQTAENVAVVVNESSADSKRLGEYYAQKRGLPPDHVIRIQVPLGEVVDRTAFVEAIERPIASAISRARLQDRILYLVLTKGVPLRIVGTPGRDGTEASVDSELTLLYRRMTGQNVPVRGPVENP
jgi:uncharacterized protein (TIGR03790 family)